MPRKWPSTQVLLCDFSVLPGTVSQTHLPPDLDSFGSLISVPYGAKVSHDRVTVALAAGDDFLEIPGHRLGRDDLVLGHESRPEFQRLDRLRAVDQDFAGLEIDRVAARGIQPRREAADTSPHPGGRSGRNHNVPADG